MSDRRRRVVTGPVASRLAGPGRLLWAAATLACLASATFAARRLAQTPRPLPIADVAAVLLLPIAAFAAWCIVFASVIVPVFYPHRSYATGLGLWRTAVLLLRNGVLIYATVSLWLAVRKMGRVTA